MYVIFFIVNVVWCKMSENKQLIFRKLDHCSYTTPIEAGRIGHWEFGIVKFNRYDGKSAKKMNVTYQDYYYK